MLTGRVAAPSIVATRHRRDLERSLLARSTTTATANASPRDRSPEHRPKIAPHGAMRAPDLLADQSRRPTLPSQLRDPPLLQLRQSFHHGTPPDRIQPDRRQ